MAPTKKTTRRTRSAIAALSVEAVKAELVAAGIRPVEFVTVDDELYLYDYKKLPKLEPHQRWDFAEWAPRASDPFATDYYKRHPPDDLPTIWRTQLYDHELKTFVESLSRTQVVAQLKEVAVDERFDRKPEPSWTIEEYRDELQARLRRLDTTTKKGKSA